MISADILPVSEQWEYTSVEKRRFIGNRMWKPHHPQKCFYPVLTTQIFTHSKIIWHVQFACWTCPNFPLYSLNVKVISSFCILEPIQLVFHVTKSRAVKCHFPLCSWWRAENGDTLGKARSGRCLHTSCCFSQGQGALVWLGGCLPGLYLSVLWHDLNSLGPGAAWAVKHTELPRFAVLRGEAQSASQVSYSASC